MEGDCISLEPGMEGDCISLERLESYGSLSTDGPSFSRWSKILLSFQITTHFNFSRICVIKVIYLKKIKHLIIWNERSASHRENMVFMVFMPLERIVYIKIILVLYIQVLKFENS
jgi:hypothetical protein